MSQVVNTLRLDDAIPGLEDLDGVVSLSVGVMADATNIETGALVAEYAIYNEFGTEHIPARPAMRATLDANADHYVNLLGNFIMSGLNDEGPMDPEMAMDATAQFVEGDMKKNIAEWQQPPNTEETIARKAQKNGGTAPGPLKDTGAYLKAITSRVDKE